LSRRRAAGCPASTKRASPARLGPASRVERNAKAQDAANGFAAGRCPIHPGDSLFAGMVEKAAETATSPQGRKRDATTLRRPIGGKGKSAGREV